MTAKLTPEAAVSTIEQVVKSQPGYRRAHSRGIGIRGVFQACDQARALSAAPHLQGDPVPCVVRFSNASGNPCAPDRSSATEGRVLGLAIRFELPGGGASTWAGINIAAFPARTPEEFMTITRAQAPGPNGKPSMLRLIWHILKHLHILAGIKAIKGLKPSGSFALEAYHGIHTYYLVDGAGKRTPFRYHWIPRTDSDVPTPEEIRGRPGLYLLNEIRARLAKGPASWDLVAQFPAAGDPIDDPSAQWPDDRAKAVLGRLTLDRVHEDQKAVEGMVFDPTNVPPGLELSDDPVLRFRPLAYGVSFDRRSKEKRKAPAPEDMGQ
jgi:catalase